MPEEEDTRQCMLVMAQETLDRMLERNETGKVLMLQLKIVQKLSERSQSNDREGGHYIPIALDRLGDITSQFHTGYRHLDTFSAQRRSEQQQMAGVGEGRHNITDCSRFLRLLTDGFQR